MREWVRGQRPKTCTAGPGARERGRGVRGSQGGRAQRTATPRHAHCRGTSEGQPETRLERPGHQQRAGRRDERVRGSEADTWNGRTKGGSKTIDEQIAKKSRKNSALHDATKTDLGQRATEEISV